MKASRKLFALALLVSVSAESYSASCTNVVGAWQNDVGSTMLVDKNEKGIISGTFQLSPNIDQFKYTMVGVLNSKPKNNEASNVPAVSFSVHWGFLGSIGNWVGVCRGDKSLSKLELIGHQVVPNAKQANEHIYTHQDTFHPKLDS